jgi:hypothetical protein
VRWVTHDVSSIEIGAKQIHFGNMLAVQRADGEQSLMLIDWEVSEVMPLGYEFVMLYTFLFDPTAQVQATWCPPTADRVRYTPCGMRSHRCYARISASPSRSLSRRSPSGWATPG